LNCIKKIVQNNYDSVLILEDDAILFDNFLNNFGKYMRCVPSDYDVLFINAGCNLHAYPTRPGQIWYKVPETRTCCAYIITKKACEKLLPNIVPFSHSIDHILGKHFHSLNLNVYWCEPNLIGDGSETVYGVSYPK
jgi:GR25 family glycosyltransferase involved in LPS biosynthesis